MTNMKDGHWHVCGACEIRVANGLAEVRWANGTICRYISWGCALRAISGR